LLLPFIIIAIQQAGPGAIRKWFALFDKDGNNEIDQGELRELMVDFGLNLSEAQIAGLMHRIDSNQNGLLDQGELIAALLPSDQVVPLFTALRIACLECLRGIRGMPGRPQSIPWAFFVHNACAGEIDGVVLRGSLPLRPTQRSSRIHSKWELSREAA